MTSQQSNSPINQISSRHDTFWKLHETGCFILPNPWDVGSAKWLKEQGYPALASTSSGYAYSRGLVDGAVPVEEVLHHLRELVLATDIPVNADFEDGHAKDLKTLKENIKRCVETGVSGISIEDSIGNAGGNSGGRSSRDPESPLYDFETAVSRMKAAREAIDETNQRVMLIGRAECFIVGRPDLAETIRRLKAYSEAGADCLYAPALSTEEQIRAVVEAVHPKPVNVMLGPAAKLGYQKISELGVRRISTGGALAISAWNGLAEAAVPLKTGDFTGLFLKRAQTVTHKDLFQVFRNKI